MQYVPAPVSAADGNKACGLLTPSELESVLGTKVSLSGGGGMAVQRTELCTGKTSTSTVMLRLVTGLDPGRDRSGGTEKKGIEMVKQMGVQVEVKTFGPITCSTMVPPPTSHSTGSIRPARSPKRPRSPESRCRRRARKIWFRSNSCSRWPRRWQSVSSRERDEPWAT